MTKDMLYIGTNTYIFTPVLYNIMAIQLLVFDKSMKKKQNPKTFNPNTKNSISKSQYNPIFSCLA